MFLEYYGLTVKTASDGDESKLLKKVVTRGVKNDGVVPESIGIIEGEAGETIRSDRVRIFRQRSEVSYPEVGKILLELIEEGKITALDVE